MEFDGNSVGNNSFKLLFHSTCDKYIPGLTNRKLGPHKYFICYHFAHICACVSFLSFNLEYYILQIKYFTNAYFCVFSIMCS